jgi:3-oxoacyl-[acyl-carrier-protein] synthase II
MGGDRSIVISGIGAVTGFGVGWPRARDALARGARALRAVGAAIPGLDGFTLGIAPELDAFRGEFPELSPPLPLRETQMVLLAAREAMLGAGLSPGRPREDVGVFLDRTWEPGHLVPRMIEPFLAGGPQKISPLLFAQSVANAPAGAVARLLGVRGQNLTTMGGGAVYLAVQALRRGEAAALLAGGFEDVQPDYLLSEEQLGRIHPRARPEAYAPYDLAGPGATLGEGAVVLVLEPAEAAATRGARIHAGILGVAVASDPEAPRGVELLAECAAAALADAGVRPEDVDAFVGGAGGEPAHGRAEIEALARLGVRGVKPESLKGLLGETLGMAASVSVAWAAATARAATLVLDATHDGGVFAAVVAGVAG